MPDNASLPPARRPRHQVQCLAVLAAYAAVSVPFLANAWASAPDPVALSANLGFWAITGAAACAVAAGLWTGRLQPEDA